MKAYHDIINRAIDILRQGGVILYPTDTIWGLGCDATNDDAIERIYAIKQRNESKSMLILLDTDSKLPYYVRRVPDIAWQLIDVSDNPLTLIYPGARNVSPGLLADDGSLGIRIVNDDFCADLVARLRKPLVSTSANIAGEKPPANFSEISDEIKDSADYIVPLRQNEKHKKTASSIIKLEIDGQFKIIR